MRKKYEVILVLMLFFIFIVFAGCGPREVAEPVDGLDNVVEDEENGDDKEEFYRWGSVINFAKGGNASIYQGEGWSGAEPDFTWTDSHKAVLRIPVTEAESDVILSAFFHAFLVPGKVEQQRVRILVNDREVGEWVITEGGVRGHKVIIPRNLIDETLMEIVFELPDAASPAEVGISEDRRTLSIAMRTIILSDYRWGSKIDFAKGGNAPVFQGEGWSGAEPDFTWTDGNRAVLHIPVGEVDSDVTLSAVFHAFLPPEKVERQRVVIVVNGQEIGEWVVVDRGVGRHDIVIPADLLDKSPLEIVFELPDAISPKEAGVSEDSRTLGIAVRTIELNK